MSPRNELTHDRRYCSFRQLWHQKHERRTMRPEECIQLPRALPVLFVIEESARGN